jgi:hypothetical protein
MRTAVRETHETMAGFRWSEREGDLAHRPAPGDLWCVRDAFCALMRWEPGSNEWDSFVEAPLPGDMDRLVEHLGLVWFDPEHESHKLGLQASLDHPGITVYAFHLVQMSHCLYQPHIRHLRDLPPQYRLIDLNPELFRIIVDTRQPPRATTP